ncbi:hypothetical protein [Desulfosporosinus sp. FKB]|uniref:hypothetical protein n=1 Tax=Desulfosporosinus sp. FKB TaxID=1969835 RepID=UPI001FA91A46|nr:hypothetical protein [Desulfosporosinus sp. FKB]
MRMPFRPPTDYYCEELAQIDEQICSLLAKRKELSNNNPGFPNLELISSWSQKFGFNQDWLQGLFAKMMHEEIYMLMPVEPTDFLKFIPILKSVEIDKITYAVTYMKQYSNASVVYIEAEVNTPEPIVRLGHVDFELFISPDYQCRPSNGCGHGKGMQRAFVVTPALPDDLTGFEFRLNIKPIERSEFPEVPFAKTTISFK